MPRPAPEVTARLSAAALTGHALSIEIDNLTDLDHPNLSDVDIYSRWDHSLGLVDEICCCQRGGDQRGWHLIETPHEMEPLVEQILTNWRGIDPWLACWPSALTSSQPSSRSALTSAAPPPVKPLRRF